jgi:hypothetical protein
VSSAAPPAAARPKSAARAEPARAPAPERDAAPPAGEHALALALHPGAARTPLTASPPPPPGVKTLRRSSAGGGGGGGGDADRGVAAGVHAEGGGGVAEAVQPVIGAGGGRPLDPATRAFFEAGFGAGLGGVRVHTGPRADASARAVDALAYTVGRDVVFRAGRYAPESGDGRRLLAHELAHVMQGAGTVEGPAPLRIGGADEPAERHADAAASAVLAGRRPPPATLAPQPPAVRRTPPPAAAPPAPAAAPALTGPQQMATLAERALRAMDSAISGTLLSATFDFLLAPTGAARTCWTAPTR